MQCQGLMLEREFMGSSSVMGVSSEALLQLVVLREFLVYLCETPKVTLGVLV